MESDGNVTRLSIITPCLNRAEVVAEAVESTLRQDVRPFEHIVVDGGSTDGTLEILSRYPHLRLISEPDSGVYDAINKGIALARGDVIGILNTDDRYEREIFGLVLRTLDAAPHAAGAAGGARIFEREADEERTIAVHQERSMKILQLSTITRGAPVINARFFRREVFERVGDFDLRFPVAADRDFLLRAWSMGVRFEPLAPIVYHYRAHQGSLTFAGTTSPSTTDEYLAICRRYLADLSTSGAVKGELVKWRAQQIGRAVRDQVLSGNFTVAWARATQGFLLDPVWPLRFLANGLVRQVHRVRHPSVHRVRRLGSHVESGRPDPRQ